MMSLGIMGIMSLFILNSSPLFGGGGKMSVPKPIYVALCLLIPLAWGMVSDLIVNLMKRRGPRRRG